MKTNINAISIYGLVGIPFKDVSADFKLSLAELSNFLGKDEFVSVVFTYIDASNTLGASVETEMSVKIINWFGYICIKLPTGSILHTEIKTF